jgi:hypothetical protein
VLATKTELGRKNPRPADSEKSRSNRATRANGNEPSEPAIPILISKATGQTFDRTRPGRAVAAQRKEWSRFCPAQPRSHPTYGSQGALGQRLRMLAAQRAPALDIGRRLQHPVLKTPAASRAEFLDLNAKHGETPPGVAAPAGSADARGALWEYFGPSVHISNERTRPQFPAKPLLISAPQRAVTLGRDSRTCLTETIRMKTRGTAHSASSSYVRLREVTLHAARSGTTWPNAGWTA